jgi:predicted TPR repeat methyltransferase
MGQLQKFKQDYILMVEAGFIAVNQTDEDSAVKLFNAAALLDPSNLLPKIGMGYIHLVKLELKQAVKVFEEVLAVDPHNETAKAFLGISMSLNPAEGAKGEKVLEDSAKHAKDPMVKNLAVTALDFVEKFVKKAPSPAQVHPKTK